MSEQEKPAFSAADLSENEFDKLTANFKSSMQQEIATEESIQATYGFYVKAYQDHAVSRGLVINGNKVSIFARTSITGGRELAESIGVVSAKIRETNQFDDTYVLPFAVTPTNQPKQMLRCRLVKVDVASFNRYAHAAAMIPVAKEDEEVYVLLIGDDNNALPSEDNYNDIGQYRYLDEPKESTEE